MYIVRDIMYLKFGHFRDARLLMEDAMKAGFMPETVKGRILSDFTGDAYRMILEQSFNSLGEYEQRLQQTMSEAKWKGWYEQLKQHVDHSHREILRQVM
ncbi:MAG TPA: hypothetical protein VHE59_15165 [Mucilaginibacter sp.]|nr:hypothetical protein [Mucilaginibacter sp.]